MAYLFDIKRFELTYNKSYSLEVLLVASLRSDKLDEGSRKVFFLTV